MNKIATIFHPLRINKSTLLLFKFIIAAAVLLVLLHKISLSAITEAFGTASGLPIMASLGLLSVNLVLQFSKWSLLAQKIYSFPPKIILESLLAGFTLGLITPGRLGEYGRSFFLDTERWQRWVGLIMIDKFFSLLILSLFGYLAVLYFFYHQFSPVLIGLFFLFIAAIFSFILIIVWVPDMGVRLAKKVRIINRWPRIKELLTGIESLDRSNLQRLLLLSTLHVTTYLTQMALLIKAFVPLAFLKGWVASAAIMFTKSFLPIALGDLGIRESASVYFFSKFNIDPAMAFNASLLLFCINILLPSLFGLLVILKKHNGNHGKDHLR
ncbi:hypothetical protein GF406_04205 [candidate division KSB1 bacterium]|nr:hypothetical protein [candidate division KSB1 bacterium]